MSEAAAPPAKAVVRSPNPHNYHWQQTMLRIKDPAQSVPFYQDHFGMTLVDKYEFPQYSFSLYFMATLPPDEAKAWPTPGTDEAHQKLWNTQYTTLELTHNHGTEAKADFKHNNGNVEPHRGFGHIAFLCDDVYAACQELEKRGIAFQKRPDEGRMKGLAFALDPDGYWLEIIKRDSAHTIPTKFNLAQTMIRIKDPAKSLPFYTERLGMTLISERHFESAKFSLYFLASTPPTEELPAAVNRPEAGTFMKKRFAPVLELTHNHGTETDDAFSYHNGNTEPRGYGHIGYLVDDVHKACAELEAAGVPFKKKPNDGNMKGLAFAIDPDGYLVEIIPRGFST